MKNYDICIIGSGPAACSAGIYAARNNYNIIMFTDDISKQGGQLTTTDNVENYLGFDSIGGYEITERFYNHVKKYENIELVNEAVLKVNFSEYPFNIVSNSNIIKAKSVIIATGSKAKLLNFVNFDKYWNKGISTCATCDGPLPIYRNRPLFIIGGGDTAFEEAVFLSKFTKEVYLVIRKDKARASKILQTRVKNKKNIKILYNSNVISAFGKEFLEKIEIRSNIDNTIQIMNCNGIFVAIGYIPTTEIFKNQIDLYENGYIKVNPGTTLTSIPGVFACGDVQDSKYKQAITSASTGCMAALDADKFLSGDLFYPNKKNIFSLRLPLFGKKYEFIMQTQYDRMDLDLTQ